MVNPNFSSVPSVQIGIITWGVLLLYPIESVTRNSVELRRIRQLFWNVRRFCELFRVCLDNCGSPYGSVRTPGSPKDQTHQIGPRQHKPNRTSTQKVMSNPEKPIQPKRLHKFRIWAWGHSGARRQASFWCETNSKPVALLHCDKMTNRHSL